jgi:nitrite reductase/ring-hydroxylating ferredoxin subunit
MDFINDDNSSLDISWHILSHWFLRPIHKYLDKKIYKLNVRLQEEDYVIRSQRALLRKYGYNFKSDPPDYYSSNKLTNNTVYPSLKYPIKINIKEFTRINALNNKKGSLYKFGEKEISFIVKKISNIEFYIWPSVCPHEGASLEDGDFCDNRVTCPWHGLNFTGSKLSKEKNTISKYGFIYKLENDFITISNNKS